MVRNVLTAIVYSSHLSADLSVQTPHPDSYRNKYSLIKTLLPEPFHHTTQHPYERDVRSKQLHKRRFLMLFFVSSSRLTLVACVLRIPSYVHLCFSNFLAISGIELISCNRRSATRVKQFEYLRLSLCAIFEKERES